MPEGGLAVRAVALVVVAAGLAAPALACDAGLMGSIPLTPPPAGQDLHVLTGRGTASPPGGGPAVVMAGARVVYNSAHPVAWWREVLLHPETQDDWAPEAMGTERVERLDSGHIFQQSNVKALGGAVSIQRQSVAQIKWMSRTDQHTQNCWQAVDAAPYMPKIQQWVNAATWLDIGFGGWQVDERAGGGSQVSYQFWVAAEILPAGMMAWGMSRTLPDLIRTFDARAAAVGAGAP